MSITNIENLKNRKGDTVRFQDKELRQTFSDFVNRIEDEIMDKADIESPLFTGKPKAPTPEQGSNNRQIATTEYVERALGDKQDTLIFDNVPIENSGNPVTSSGIYTAIQNLGRSVDQAAGNISRLVEGAAASARAAGQSETNAQGYARNAAETLNAINLKSQDVEDNVHLALGYKNNAARSADLAESYAHGQTGKRQGENTDNAKYYSEQAQRYAELAEQEAADAGYFFLEMDDNGYIYMNKIGSVGFDLAFDENDYLVMEV